MAMAQRRPATRKNGAGLTGQLAICGGTLLGLWITGCILFAMHSSGDGDKASPRHFAVVHNQKSRADAPGAPQALLSSAQGIDAHTKLDASHTPLKKGTTKYTLVERQIAAVSLVQRVVGRDAAILFDVRITGKGSPLDPDTFQVSDIARRIDILDGPLILLTGTNGVAVASALNWYLRYTCKVDTSWNSPFPLQLPETLPSVGKPITRNSLVRWGYYENVCTHSYTQAWWDWARWEREIDWMAMSGINLPLALTGQEAVIQRVFLRMGLTHAQIAPYFTGPAFLAWNRMINIKSWAGHLPQSWIDGQQQLQQRILERERSLGMTPVLPAFAGGVPEAMQISHPTAKFTRHGNWGNFFDAYE